jgi:hypothetical protein
MEASTATRGGSLLEQRFGIAGRASTVRVELLGVFGFVAVMFATYHASGWLSAHVF